MKNFMKTKRKLNIREKITGNLLMAFFLPVIAFLIAFISLGVHPFGDTAVMIIDSYHQYVPFFSELHDKIWHGDSLLYSWHGSLGYNFLALQAYYLASPLNILIAVFPAALMIECFETLIVLKVALSSVTAYLFLKARTGRDDLFTVLFAGFYALGGFTLAYNWNVMWLDSIVLFPLIVWGAQKLIDEGDGRLYTVCLGLAIFCNYYMAIMICIFLILYFFVYYFSVKRDGIRHFFKRGFLYAGCSVLSGGLAAVYLLPTYYTMIDDSQGSAPTSLEFYRSFWDLTKQLFVMTEPTELEGAPNLYCGVFVAMLIPVFVLTKKISWREKILRILLTAFIFISFNVNYLDYIWHGFHFPNNLPGRFSFIFILLMVMMAYDAFYWIKSINLKALLLSFGLEAVLFGVILIRADETIEIYTIALMIIFMAVYAILLLAYRRGFSLAVKGKRILPGFVLTLVLAVELVGNAVYSIDMNGTVTYSSYTGDRAEVAAIRDEYESEDTFYRMELAQTRGRDDVVWQHLNGLSFFSSTCDDSMETLIGGLGFYNSGNKYTYRGATPLTDAMLDMRYIISNTEMEAYNLSLDDESETKYIYKNNMNLALGYMTNDTVTDWNVFEGCPFVIQNEFAQMATDVTEDLFDSLIIGSPETSGATITNRDDEKWYYTSNSSDASITWQLQFNDPQDIYIYFEASHCTELDVYIDGEETTYSDEKGHIVHLGECDAGKVVTLSFKLDDSFTSGNIELQEVAFNSDVFDEVYDQLADEQLNVTSYDSTHVTGSITAEKDGVMMLSVPYDEGWTVKVDGQKVDTFRIGGALTGIDLTAGEHEITMSYMPQGLIPGAAISLVSLLILLF